MTDKRSTRSVAFAVAVMGLSALVCFTRLADDSLWNDEAFSFFVSWRGVAETLSLVKLDTQPPLYYLVLNAWLHLGHSPFVLRAMSALAIVAATGLLFGAGQRLLGVRIAILACVLFAVDGTVVEWAQRARPYALQAFFAALMLWGFARIWTEGGKAGWVAYCVAGAAGVLTQYPVGFMLVGVNAAMAWRIFSDLGRNRGLLLRWVLAQLVLAGLAALWLPSFHEQMSADLTPAAIATRHGIYLISFSGLLDSLSRLMSVSALYSRRAPFLAAFGVSAVLGAWSLVRRRQGVPVVAMVVVALGIWLLGWRFVHPLFGYVAAASVWFVLPYALLLAAGVASLPRWAGAGLMAALCLGDALGLYNFYQTSTVPLDRAAAVIGPEIGARDGVLFGDHLGGRWGLAYYLGPPYAGKLRGLDVLDLSNFEHAPDPGQKVRWLIQGPEDTAGLERLWVLRPTGEKPLVDPAVALPGGREAFRRELPGLVVERFDRAGAE